MRLQRRTNTDGAVCCGRCVWCVKAVKLGCPDFRDMDADTAAKEFGERIEFYKEVYCTYFFFLFSKRSSYLGSLQIRFFVNIYLIFLYFFRKLIRG